MVTTLADVRQKRRRSRPDGQLLFALIVLGLFVGMAVLGLFIGRQATSVNVAQALQAPGAEHWFGTDAQGRDVFARVAVGSGIALVSGTLAVAIGATIGLIVALLCGLGPRWLDNILVRVSDAILAFPQLLLALAIAMALGSGLTTAVIDIIVTVFPVFTRTLRAEAMRSKKEPFIEAARTIGMSTPRIAVRHVVPYVSTTLIVQAAANFGQVILILAGLSFIGVGAQPPTPEWGAMITEGLQNALTGQWWIGVFPGLSLLLVVVAINMLSDQLPKVLSNRGKRN